MGINSYFSYCIEEEIHNWDKKLLRMQDSEDVSANLSAIREAMEDIFFDRRNAGKLQSWLLLSSAGESWQFRKRTRDEQARLLEGRQLKIQLEALYRIAERLVDCVDRIENNNPYVAENKSDYEKDYERIKGYLSINRTPLSAVYESDKRTLIKLNLPEFV